MTQYGRFRPNVTPCGRTRREFLWEVGGGFAGLALVDLLWRDGFFARPAQAAPSAVANAGGSLLAARAPHLAGKAKRCIFLFMNGAPSHVDTFDPKPALTKHDGQPYRGPLKVGSNGRPIGYLMRSPFEFRRHGQSGLPISSLFPHLARHADDLCVLRAMYTDTAAHASGCLQMNTGSVLLGKPSLGAWLSYGLGTSNENLPSFVVMTDPRGGPIGSASNWSSGFMPAAYQGTLFRSAGSPLLDLVTPPGISDRSQRESIELVNRLNRRHLAARPGETELAARILSYELAYRMQTSVPELTNFAEEPKHILDLYGPDVHTPGTVAANCLLARRLAERNVRFTLIFQRGWDHHGNLPTDMRLQCRDIDQPCAGLIQDLKQRGMLDDTLVIWGGEFGRTPMVQAAPGGPADGRDHHPNAFTMWLAGGGMKRGFTMGESDDLGFNVTQDKVHVHDLHATILKALGFDHTKLTFKFQGRNFRLTDVSGNVVEKMLA